jgi:hypothetical protein
MWLSKANKIYLKQNKSTMWCPYITPKKNYIKIILVTKIFGELSVFSPCFGHSKFGPLCSSELKFVGLCDSCTSMLENNWNK